MKEAFRRISLTGVLVMAAVALLAGSAAAQAPHYRLYVTAPDDLTAGLPFVVQAVVENNGNVPLVGNVTVTETFPNSVAPVSPELAGTVFGSSCQTAGQQSICTVNVEGFPPGAQARLVYRSFINLSAEGTLVDTTTATGGGMPGERVSSQTMVVGPPGPFEIKRFSMNAFDANLEPEVTAGSAPSQLANALVFRTFNSPAFGNASPSEHLKDTVMHVPAGLIGNPTAVPRCSAEQFTTGTPGGYDRIPDCAPETQVGTAHIHNGFGPEEVPVYNLVPPPGFPAAFGLFYSGITVILTPKLRASDDGIDIVALKAPSTLPLDAVEVTLWGTPADSSHDYVRGVCLNPYLGNYRGNVCPSSAPRTPFLRLPTSCTGSPLPWSADLTTYEHPNPSEAVHAETTTPAMTGCERLPFAPSFSLAPGELVPHAPSGVDATLSMPQETAPEGLEESDLRTATVTLPEGVSINPSSADGLQACSDEQLKLGVEGVATCPDASKIGTLTVTTPTLDHPVGGSIFLRPQASSDPASGQMFRVALEIRSDDDGIDVKLPAQIKLDPATGQVTTVVADSPQLPFSSVELHFKEGPRAPLSTPRACGTYTTSSTFTSWSGKTVNDSNSHFTISGDGHGAPCAPSGFAPVLKAGTVNNRADASSPFVLRLTRTDADQPLSTLSSITMPPGLIGDIASVPVRCSEAQVAAVACPEASRIGNVTAGAGVGSDPFYITDGNAYLTGPYNGAPFGLAFIVHAKAGPFDLGYVTVRAAIQIDPRTAQVTVLSGPLPTIVKGVPVQLRDLRVTIDRPGFMLNPTGCQATQILGTVASTEGATATVSSRFQAAECANLGFRPSFKAATSAKTSRKDGASLRVSLLYPKAPFGSQANIRSVHVELPKALPSRLSTLNHACPDSVFNQNPAGCPAQSRVGYAKSTTPVLPVPLEGPAYFVSHGSEEFPDLVVVLQGDGVTIDLVGTTLIKNGVTSSTFKQVPDVPVNTFELTLPQGPFSALAANTNLCETSLAMPTAFTAQNGATLNQSTAIAVTGCPYALRIVHRSVKNRTLTLKVLVPVGGRLVASGTGVSTTTKTAKGRSTLTLDLKEGRAGNLRTKVLLRFTPGKGKGHKGLRKSVTVTFH